MVLEVNVIALHYENELGSGVDIVGIIGMVLRAHKAF